MNIIFLFLILTTFAFGQSRSSDRVGASFDSGINNTRPRGSYDSRYGSSAQSNRFNDSNYNSNGEDSYYESQVSPRSQSSGLGYSNRSNSRYEDTPRSSNERWSDSHANNSRADRTERPERNSHSENGSRQGRSSQLSDSYVEESLASANSIMNRVELRNGSDQRTLNRMRSLGANLVLHEGDTGVCRGNAAYKLRNRIYICPAFYTNPSIENGQYMILHELVHLTGTRNECAADDMAGKILAAAGEPVLGFYNCGGL